MSYSFYPGEQRRAAAKQIHNLKIPDFEYDYLGNSPLQGAKKVAYLRRTTDEQGRAIEAAYQRGFDVGVLAERDRAIKASLASAEAFRSRPPASLPRRMGRARSPLSARERAEVSAAQAAEAAAEESSDEEVEPKPYCWPLCGLRGRKGGARTRRSGKKSKGTRRKH